MVLVPHNRCFLFGDFAAGWRFLLTAQREGE